MSVVIVLIILLTWLSYTTYCGIKGLQSNHQFSTHWYKNRQRNPLLATLTSLTDSDHAVIRGTIYGTVHTMSYLISNARILNKRRQQMDIIGQLQCGIRAFDLGIRLRESSTARNDSRRLSLQAILTTNNVDTDLSVWHVLEILNGSASHCGIAKIIVVISFTNSHLSINVDEAQKYFWDKIKKRPFDHLFITSRSIGWMKNKHHWQRTRHWSLQWCTVESNISDFLHKESILIAAIIEKMSANKHENAHKRIDELVWLDGFDPYC